MIADAFRTPLRHLRANAGRFVLTVIALALGVALICAVDLVNRAVFDAFVEVIDTVAGRAAIQVTAGEGGLFPEEIAATVGEAAGVQLAVPVVSATAFVADGSEELLTVHGVDIANDAAVRVYEARDAGGLELEDPLVFLNQPDSIVLTRTFSARRGLSVGDTIILLTPTGERAFTVRGLLEPRGVGRVFGGNLAVMDLYAAEVAFTQPGLINRVDVVTAPSADLPTVTAAISARLPPGLRAESAAQRKLDLNRVMQSIRVLLTAVALVAFIVAFLIAFSRLATVFETRAWQLGVMRAIGLRVRIIWWELVKESLLLGVVGVVAGIPLGVMLGRLLLPAITTTAALAHRLARPDATISVQASSLGAGAILGVVTAALAASLPAWRAARVAITEMLRTHGREQPERWSWTAWILRSLAAVGLGAALLLQSTTHSAVWGLSATALIVVLTALAARPALALMRRLLGVVPSLAGPSGRFAAAELTANARRTALAAGTLGVGLGVVLWLWMVAVSFERSIVENLTGVVRADIMITSAQVASGFMNAPVDENLARDLRSVEGVAAVAAERVLDWHYGGGPITVNAFDAAYFINPEFGQWPLHGPALPDVWRLIADRDGVLISSNFALNMGAAVGDTINLDSPSGPVPLQVAGITVDYGSPRGTVEMNRVLYQRFWHDSQVSLIFVEALPGADLGAVRRALSKHVGSRHRLRILSAHELIEYYAGQVSRAFAGVLILAGLVLVVVLVGVADTLAAGVAERTRALGAVRALGVRRRAVGHMILFEALGLGLLGLLLALTTGWALGTLWVEATFPYMIGWLIDLHLPVRQSAATGVLALAVCLGAAVLPARRVARLEAAIALRYE